MNVWYREAKAVFEPAEGKPGQSAEDTPHEAPKATKAEPRGPQITVRANMPTYTVRRGDTLIRIARRLGLRSYTDLTGYRSGNPNLIYPGEVLHYDESGSPPGSSSGGSPPPPPPPPPIAPAPPDSGDTAIGVIPFNERVPLLIAHDPHSRTKGDLKSTPTPTSVFPLPVQGAIEVARALPTATLERQMTLELSLGGGPIGVGLARDFFANAGLLVTKTHGAGTPLSDLVKASPEFTRAHADVQSFIRDVVQATAFAGTIDYRELAEPKKKVPPPSLSFRGWQPLHVLIGSFQGVKVFLFHFSADTVRRTYSANLTYEFFDHFGVDDGDGIPDTHGHGSPGQMAFWVLQRERRPGHMPYITRVVVNQAIIDDSF